MPESRRLVIDASVARRAGAPGSRYPAAVQCRKFLTTVRDFGHRIVMSPEIRAEWDEHQQLFARRWRFSMLARKRLQVVPVDPDWALRDRLDEVAPDDNARDAMYKDACLIEAALDTDSTVASLDERVRALFRQAADQVGELRAIVWVNPEREEDEPISWLERGAPAEPERMLGYALSA